MAQNDMILLHFSTKNMPNAFCFFKQMLLIIWL